MEKIEYFQEVLHLLKDKEIVFIQKGNDAVFFAVQKDKIVAKSTGSTYRLNENEFTELFQNETFYLYETAVQDTVNHEKDEEYYSWQHK